ncbi:MAG: nitrous oxide reductase family maturation protein NosD [Halobellus sp.]|uniref:nitrous oxide reductase family maturation protein NosD n=1 Tax=Halobellus sp. TaxID=1979212 RepID=UPI0035D5114B
MKDRFSDTSRRSVLKTGLGIAGVAGLGSILSVPVGAVTTVSGGGAALQNAVDAASDGETLVVTDSTTYDPVTVDIGVTIEASGDPTIEGDGDTGAAVSIEADDVTVKGFTVTNPDGLLGIKIQTGYDGATIENNTIEDVGPTGRLGVTGIVVGQGDHDDIEITNNVIQGLDQETTDDSGFPTVNGILFDANNSDPGTITNTAVNNNTIRDVESDIAPLGIVVQHETDGVAINNNEIRDLVAADDTDSDPSDDTDFSFTFAQGINIASPSTTDTVVNHNVIENITSAETILAEAVKIDGDGGGVAFRANQFLVAVGVNNRNGTDGGSRDPSDDPVVDAKNNYWGSPDGPEKAAFNQDADDDSRSDVVGNVDFDPFLRNPPGPKGGGNGNRGGNGNGNSNGNGNGGGNGN